jgi:hypothetical protein
LVWLRVQTVDRHTPDKNSSSNSHCKSEVHGVAPVLKGEQKPRPPTLAGAEVTSDHEAVEMPAISAE